MIDELMEKLMEEPVVDNNEIVFTSRAVELIHLISEECKDIPIVKQTQEQAEDYAKEFIIGDIKNAPVAYDLDKVVEQLEERKSLYQRLQTLQTLQDRDCQQYSYKIEVLDDAIEMVRDGGKQLAGCLEELKILRELKNEHRKIGNIEGYNQGYREAVDDVLKKAGEFQEQQIKNMMQYPRNNTKILASYMITYLGHIQSVCQRFLKEQLEEQGRLIKSPYKVGNTVYCIEDQKIWTCIVEKISISRNNGVWMEASFPEEHPDLLAIEFDTNDIGKTVFRAKQDAEEKLKEVRGENHEKKSNTKKD